MKSIFGKPFIFALIIVAAVAGAVSCNKENSAASSEAVPAGQSKLSLFLTDGPYDFQQVLIDIKRVQVLVDTCKHDRDSTDDDDRDRDRGDDHGRGDDEHHGDRYHQHGCGCTGAADSCLVWNDLQINPGVYDLLTLRNGNDTLLGGSFLPQGRILAIRIYLGDSNSIMVDSVVKPLHILNNKDSIVVCVRKENLDSIAPNNFHLLLDFNLAGSIRYDGGQYWLRPVLKTYSRRNASGLEGQVLPLHGFGLVMAFNASDTAFALPNFDNGKFKIRGLTAGTYDVWFQGRNGYKDTTVNNVTVLSGQKTDLGKIVLHQ